MRIPLALFALTVLAGCSASTKIEFGSGGSGSSGSGAGGGSTGSGSTGSSMGGSGTGGGGGSQGVGGSVFFDAGPIGDGGGGATGVAQIFGNTATTLYKVDPITYAITDVGDFTGGCDTVIDIAINKTGQMWATTFTGFYQVDPTTAVCTPIATGSYPNSLSFVPAGTLDPNVEALVGYNGAQYLRIDLTSGTITNLGMLSSEGYSSSGDIVSVIGGGTYLTVNGGPAAPTTADPDCNTNDCIVQVDPKTGALMNVIGSVGHTAVYGLAYWGGAAYGFDDEGDLFQIDLTNGTPTTIPNTPAGIAWYGAGSTTSAPLVGSQ